MSCSKQRDIEHLAVDARVQDACDDRQVLDQLAALDLGQVADALDGVLVDRVAVIHVELHHRDDRLELGDEGGQHAQFVHPPQRPFGVAVLEQQIEEDPARFFVGAHLVVDQVQIGRDQPHRVGVQQGAGAQRLFEHPQHVQLVGEEAAFVGDGQAVLFDRVSAALPSCAARTAATSTGSCLVWLASSAVRKIRVSSPTWVAWRK